jgi:hypothetical protein
MAGGPDEPGGGDILVGIHASGVEPPPLPFRLERSVGGIALMARKSLVVPREPLNTEDERYFGENAPPTSMGLAIGSRVTSSATTGSSRSPSRWSREHACGSASLCKSSPLCFISGLCAVRRAGW